MNDETLQAILDALTNSDVRVSYSRRRDRSEVDLPPGILRWKGPKGGFRTADGVRAGFNVRHEAYTRGRRKHTHLVITVTPGGPADTEFYTDDTASAPPHPDRPHADSWDGWDGGKQAGLGRIVDVFGGV